MQTEYLRRIFLLSLCTLTLCGLARAADTPHLSKALQIFSYDSLQAIHFATTTTIPALPENNAAEADPGPGVTMFSFAAFDRQFVLFLEPNDRLVAALPQEQKDALKSVLQLYRGHIAAVEGSWVRLTRRGEKWSGMIWDGEELYIIDSSDEVEASLSHGAAPEPAQPIIYRLSDTSMGQARCALSPVAQPVHDYRSLVEELQQLLPALPAAVQQLNMAIVADAQFVQNNQSSPTAAVLARMNAVDGIFSNQVGVHLNIAEIRALQSNGTLTSTDPVTLLNQFGTFAASPGFTNPGLAHLFTGRDITGSVIGIAYLSSLCSSRFGVGVSEVRGSGTAGALVVAHEMGHNFGAPHDNQSGSCASTPGTFLMNPFLNGSDTFSQCSLNQIQPNVLNASCIADLPNTPSVSILAPSNGATFVAGTPIQFTGRATDGNGNDLTSALVWRSSLAGPIGSGGSFTRTLLPGTHTITAAVTNSAGNSATASRTVTVTTSGGTVLLSATFDTNTQEFFYVDNAFGTNQAAFASGDFSATGGFTGGGLRVLLGGVNSAVIFNMSGGWRRTFTVPTPQPVLLSFRYRLTQAANYEPDEVSYMLAAIDNYLLGTNGNNFVARLAGNGEGGPTQTIGWGAVQFNLGVLSGTHTLTLGGFNNKKTWGDEVTTVQVDDVVVRTTSNTLQQSPEARAVQAHESPGR